MKTTAIFLSVLGALSSTYAWGALGHETVGYVASNFLQPATVTWAQNILRDSTSSYLANVASWADSYRATTAGKFSAPYHYIDALDNPPSSCSVSYSRDCGTKGCVVSAISNYTSRVRSTTLSATEVNQALMFLVHFVGDIHQPLHDENLSLGGNQIAVTFDGASTNLHSVWDTSIPQKYAGTATLTNAQAWANTLTTAINTGAYNSMKAGWISGMSLSSPTTTATGWASGANAFVCSSVIPGGASGVQNQDLGGTYYSNNLPVVNQQIATAGYRLAAWLNLIVTGSTGMAAVVQPRSVNPVYGTLLNFRRIPVDLNRCEREP